MQPQTYSINALSTELGIDRRTLAKRLADVPPAKGSGRAKCWRLADVLAAQAYLGLGRRDSAIRYARAGVAALTSGLGASSPATDDARDLLASLTR